MSTKDPRPKDVVTVERRRKPEAVRKDALEAGRRLLIEGGPGAITLKAVGAALGMSHANLIHHFGSADAFQAQLKDLMVQDLVRKTTALVGAIEPPDTAAIVDEVFDAYDTGGIGMLMAWSVLAGAPHDEAGVTATTRELVAALEPRLEGPEAPERARRMVMLVTLLAFADSLIGKSVGTAVGAEHDAVRAMTTALVERLGAAR